MKKPAYRAHRLVRSATGAMAAACIGLVAAPAFADLPRDQEERGVYISLSGFRDRISNLDFRLASNAGSGEGARLEVGRGGEAMYQVGWLLPGRKGSVALTYWEYGETAGTNESAAGTPYAPTGFLDAVANRSRIDAQVRILARSVDAAYAREFKSAETFRASWSLGLRYFRYEHLLKAEYFGSGELDHAFEQVESIGVGPRVGASFQYYFTPRWSLAAGTGLATLFGTSDHSNVSRTRFSTPSETVTFLEERGTSRTFSQADLDIHMVFKAWRELEVSAGYRVSHWFDARSRHLFTGEAEVERVTFDGPYLNVGYRF